MAESVTYRAIAAEEYSFWLKDIENGNRYPSLTAKAQEIAEKFLKDVLDNYALPNETNDVPEIRNALRSHNLLQIVDCIVKSGLPVTNDLQWAVLAINGFYFTTRYPGPDYFRPNESHYLRCRDSLKTISLYVEELEAQLDKGIAPDKIVLTSNPDTPPLPI